MSVHIIFEIASGICCLPSGQTEKKSCHFWQWSLFFLYLWQGSQRLSRQYFSYYCAFIITSVIIIMLSSMTNKIISVCYSILVKKVVFFHFIFLHQRNCVQLCLLCPPFSFHFNFLFQSILLCTLKTCTIRIWYHPIMCLSLNFCCNFSIRLLFSVHFVLSSSLISRFIIHFFVSFAFLLTLSFSVRYLYILDVRATNFFIVYSPNSCFISPIFFFFFSYHMGNSLLISWLDVTNLFLTSPPRPADVYSDFT